MRIAKKTKIQASYYLATDINIVSIGTFSHFKPLGKSKSCTSNKGHR